jgi:hypothetical protein
LTRPIKWTAAVSALIIIFSAFAGYWAASMSLHPARRALTPELIAQADEVFRRDHATRIPWNISAPEEYRRRVLAFFTAARATCSTSK